ncbi:MAG TPA: dihydroorotase [Candidatus Onthenecus intestinigallinarum]|uniref:Dihydroorotase n=1 Tax=Candidatus Onthenecus intestinigallinarum TaxID=2840875 RepID=A0A9D1CRI4_9FIRM|nr:dihydroorotase [Candidatus Onthenecus intestinigallinarum]
MKTILRGGRVIDPSQNLDGVMDVLIEDGRIAELCAHAQKDGAEVIDASGLCVLPGLVDIHCHLRDPGFEYKEDIATGTQSAAAGGFTSICCMPNTNPVNDCAAVTRYILERAATVGSGVHVYPIGAISKGLKGGELAEIGTMKEAGIVAISDDGKPVVNPNLMRLALIYADHFDVPVVSHSEDPDLVDGGVMNEGYMSTLLGLRGTTRAAEEVMIARDILVAETYGKRIHLCHVSTKGGVQLIREAKARGVRVTAETAPHYIGATDAWVEGYDTNTRVNPPLRTEEDRLAVIAGLVDGTLDCIATDHAPHHADEKNVEYPLAASGMVGFETAFAVCYTELVEKGYMDLPRLVSLMTCKPARILNLPAGTLAPGTRADIALVDLARSWTVDAAKLHSKSKNTPFDGRTYTGRVKRTLCAGRTIYEEA